MQTLKFEKFIKLMMMTTSANDGECLNALRMANAQLAEANLDWNDFLRGKAAITDTAGKSMYSGKKYTNAADIDNMLNTVLGSLKHGTSFHNFIVSLSDWWKANDFLTEKQYNALRKTYERL